MSLYHDSPNCCIKESLTLSLLNRRFKMTTELSSVLQNLASLEIKYEKEL